jgi:hypothetical protein
MKIAIIGSRSIIVDDLSVFVPRQCTEIVSGGASGADTCAAEYARKNGIKLTELLPIYEKYGRAAPIVRNKQIVEYADEVIAFWDGKSRGTLSVINYCKKIGKPCKIIRM